MYRIEFDPSSGKFVIQVSWFGFWRKVSKAAFENYFEATEHVKAIGLNQLYQDRSINRMPQQGAYA